MTVNIQFFDVDVSKNYSDKNNRKVVLQTILNYDENEFKILLNSRLLVYFGEMSSRNHFFKSLGVLKIRGTWDYKDFHNQNIHELSSIKNFEMYKFFIYLSLDIRITQNEIEKVLTIAHELQHILQYVQNWAFFDKNRNLKIILNRIDIFSADEKLNIYHELPFEKDAVRKARIIANRMFGKNNVDNFLNEVKKNNSDSYYWEIISRVEPKNEFDHENELKKFTKWIEENYPAFLNELKKEYP